MAPSHYVYYHWYIIDLLTNLLKCESNYTDFISRKLIWKSRLKNVNVLNDISYLVSAIKRREPNKSILSWCNGILIFKRCGCNEISRKLHWFAPLYIIFYRNAQYFICRDKNECNHILISNSEYAAINFMVIFAYYIYYYITYISLYVLSCIWYFIVVCKNVIVWFCYVLRSNIIHLFILGS